MLSNSDPANGNPDDSFFEHIYSGYNVFRVSAGRAINSNGEKRGKISELLITNYPCHPQSAEIQQEQLPELPFPEPSLLRCSCSGSYP